VELLRWAPMYQNTVTLLNSNPPIILSCLQLDSAPYANLFDLFLHIKFLILNSFVWFSLEIYTINHTMLQCKKNERSRV